MHDGSERTRRRPREAPGEGGAGARLLHRSCFVRLGAAVDVSVRETPEAIGVSLAPREGNGVELSGALVEAVQYLVNRVVNPRAEGRKWVNLEVGGFPEGGDPAVRAMALRLAAAALRTGKALAVSPMSPRDRRAVHLALLEVDGRHHAQRGRGDLPPAARHPRPEAEGAAPARGARPPWRARRPGTRSSSPRRCCAARSSSPATSSGRGSSSSTTACCATWGSTDEDVVAFLAGHALEVDAAIGRRHG